MPLLPESEVADAQAQIRALLGGCQQVLFGQETMIGLVVTGLLAGGHVLLEGLPGLGKTELVKALAALSGCQYRRIQFTPDLLPGDITGTQVLHQDASGARELVFRPGPIFANIVLADEINRASPKTQSALLEAMQEHSVTALDGTRRLPEPFFVLATQNPVELDGTYPLPEAQLDRFCIKVEVRGVAKEALTRLLLERPDGRPSTPAAVLDPQRLSALLATVRRVVLPEAVARYIAALVDATRPELPTSPPDVRSQVRWGASPRAALALAGCARARALMAGRPAAGFDDVKAVAPAVVAHRLVLGYEAGLSGLTARGLVERLVSELPELPA